MDFQTDAPVQGADEEFLDPARSDDGVVRCVFSSTKTAKIGTGTTTRRHVTKLYWYVEEREDGNFSIRKINSRHVPAGEEKMVSVQKLIANYLPEIEFWEDNVIPAMKELEDYLEDGEIDREDGKYYSAEESFNKALGIEEKNVRALFNLGLIYLELKEMDKARDMIAELLKLKSFFMGKDQHLFNDLGISLRKHGMYDEAAEYYTQAMHYVDDDENLFYNLARANYERGDWLKCVEALGSCLALNPDLPASRDMVTLIQALAKDPKLCEKNGKPTVPRSVAAKIRDILDDAQSFKAKKVQIPKAFSGDSRTVDSQTGRARSGSESGKGANPRRFDLD